MAFPEINDHNKRCEVCCEDVSKYKCPRCSKRTCSVKCVNVHKTSEDCNGQRDKSVFVPISKYTDNHLLGDYRFLEDVDRTADNAARNSKKFPPKNRFVHKNKRFLKRAADRKGVQLLFLPNVFTKHNLNSSCTFKESPNTIFWCVNWKFPQSDYAEILERKISDKLTFDTVLKKYIHTTESDPIHRQRLKCYITENFDNVDIYMEYDRSIQTNKKYYKLDLHKSIEENLKGKLVIEYPTIHVVLKIDAVKYEPKVLTEDPAKEHTDENKQRIINASCEKIENERCGVDDDQDESLQCEVKEIKEEENITCGVMENQEEESLACGLMENMEESVQCEPKEIKEEENIACRLMKNQGKESIECGLMESLDEENITNMEEESVQCETKESMEEESVACGLMENQEDLAYGIKESMEEKSVECEVKETLQCGAQESQDMEEGMAKSEVNQEEAVQGTVIKQEEHDIKLTQDASLSRTNQIQSIELEEGECCDEDNNPMNTETG